LWVILVRLWFERKTKCTSQLLLGQLWSLQQRIPHSSQVTIIKH
jgi:hypothetical protein